jgi:hypothetical protein
MGGWGEMAEEHDESEARSIGRLSYKSIIVCAASDGRTSGVAKHGCHWGAISSGGYWLSNPFSFRESRYGEGKV